MLPVVFSSHAAHRHFHSFPTRRSSDLTVRSDTLSTSAISASVRPPKKRNSTTWLCRSSSFDKVVSASSRRSEEHTSELQSLTNLVCRLLLEKKKTRTSTTRSKANYSAT